MATRHTAQRAKRAVAVAQEGVGRPGSETGNGGLPGVLGGLSAWV